MSSPQRPLRIAVLEADTTLPRTTHTYGGYGGVFTRLLKLASPSPEPDITVYDVFQQQAYPSAKALAELDAIVISGSKANAFDDTPWIVELVEFTRKVLEEGRVKVLGICFGHQITGRALGMEVRRGEKGWEASVCRLPLVGKGKEIFGRDELKIFQMHKDIVSPPLPEGVENLGETEACALQGMVDVGRKRFISVQGHPEFTREIVTEILEARKELGIFAPEEFEDMMRRVGEEHDGVEIMRVFLKFVRGEI